MPKAWKSDTELFRLIRRKLFTAVVGDVLDHMGLRRQFLPPTIQPLDTEMVVVGRAMPVLEADYYTFADESAQTDVGKRAFGLMLEALDDLKANEVYVATGGTPRYAMWGELMSTRAMHLGAAGAVMNGYSRDTRGILALGFPTFSFGRYAQDQGYRGKVVDFLLFYFRQYQWPAFNVADSAIVVGAGLLVFEILFTRTPGTEKTA